jgi:hypothetical protein
LKVQIQRRIIDRFNIASQKITRNSNTNKMKNIKEKSKEKADSCIREAAMILSSGAAPFTADGLIQIKGSIEKISAAIPLVGIGVFALTTAYTIALAIFSKKDQTKKEIIEEHQLRRSEQKGKKAGTRYMLIKNAIINTIGLGLAIPAFIILSPIILTALAISSTAMYIMSNLDDIRILSRQIKEARRVREKLYQQLASSEISDDNKKEIIKSINKLNQYIKTKKTDRRNKFSSTIYSVIALVGFSLFWTNPLLGATFLLASAGLSTLHVIGRIFYKKVLRKLVSKIFKVKSKKQRIRNPQLITKKLDFNYNTKLKIIPKKRNKFYKSIFHKDKESVDEKTTLLHHIRAPHTRTSQRPHK